MRILELALLPGADRRVQLLVQIEQDQDLLELLTKTHVDGDRGPRILRWKAELDPPPNGRALKIRAARKAGSGPKDRAKVDCPKCGRAVDPRGLKAHKRSCPGPAPDPTAETPRPRACTKCGVMLRKGRGTWVGKEYLCETDAQAAGEGNA